MNFPATPSDRWKAWIAEGFGIGRVRHAPGTWGSLLGVAWTIGLLSTRSAWAYAAGTALGLALSVWLCGAAEKILNASDPSSVVLDEITAFPLCLFPLAGWGLAHGRPFPGPSAWMSLWHGWFFPSAFLLFRLFDIWKPTPIRQSQMLAGGWGVTIDDALAALAAGAILCLMNAAWT
ncbi:MAG: phosphatidylglycerophosphatase A [Verrucomicrobia bacterium]|nr:phosphatidylglycerophosphatase A [Verrucomicrobiota bacterium]